MRPFRVEVIGSFYTFELYDSRGREVFNIHDAAEAAEDEYGSDWSCVYNGQEAMTRDEYMEECCL